MKLEVSVPSVGLLRRADKARTVFKVEILCNGRRHSIEKRYSEFYALHKRIKKRCQVPDFPPKHVPNWMTKVLEQRRQGLEAYLQGILLYNRKLPKEFLDFLKLWHFHQDPRGNHLDHLLDGGEVVMVGKHPAIETYRLLEDHEFSLQDISPSSLLSHRPVVSFHNDPYVLSSSSTDSLPDIILAGVLQGLYAPETLFYLESKLLMGPGLRLQRALPSDMTSASLFLI